MDHTKDTLLELIRGTLSTTIYNQGVYILNIEEILDNYKRRMFHVNPAKRNVMVVKNEMRLLKQKRNVLQI